jgi:plasmid maintenance system antidote protein VapI
MALRVEKAVGVDMETLLRMQAWHDHAPPRRRDRHKAVSMPYHA